MSTLHQPAHAQKCVITSHGRARFKQGFCQVSWGKRVLRSRLIAWIRRVRTLVSSHKRHRNNRQTYYWQNYCTKTDSSPQVNTSISWTWVNNRSSTVSTWIKFPSSFDFLLTMRTSLTVEKPSFPLNKSHTTSKLRRLNPGAGSALNPAARDKTSRGRIFHWEIRKKQN